MNFDWLSAANQKGLRDFKTFIKTLPGNVLQITDIIWLFQLDLIIKRGKMSGNNKIKFDFTRFEANN